MRHAVVLMFVLGACGKQTSLSDAPLPGDGAGADSAALVPMATLPDSIDVGPIGCGDTIKPTFTIENTGSAALTYSIVASPTFFGVSPSDGAIAPGASTTFTLESNMPDYATAGQVIDGSLIFTSNLPGNARTIHLTMEANGAVVTLTPASANFGDVELSKSATQTVTIKNEGNATAALSIAAPADAQYTVAFAAGDLAAGDQRDATITFAPQALGAGSASAPITIVGPTCGTKPSSIAMTGTGFPLGGVLVTGNFDFGTVTCNSGTTTTRTVTLENRGTATAAWTAEIIGSSDYAVAPASGSVAGGTTATFDLTRLDAARPVAPGPHDATLRVTSTVGATSTQHDLPIKQILDGSVLSTTGPTTFDFGFVPVGEQLHADVWLQNSGAAVAAIGAPQMVGSGFFSGTTANSIGTNNSGTVDVAYGPTMLGPTTGTATIDATNACSAPIVVSLAGGTGSWTLISANDVSHDCFTPRPAGTVSITNAGNQPLTVSGCVEISNTDVHPTLSPSTVTIAASGSGAMSFTWDDPSPLHSDTTAVGIRCDTNEKWFKTRVFGFGRNVFGADLVLAPVDGFDFSCGQPGQEHRLKITNAGNRDASVLFSGSLPAGLESLGSFANVGAGSSDTSMGARVGSGGCTPGGSGTVGVFGSGAVICSQTPDLPVTTTN